MNKKVEVKGKTVPKNWVGLAVFVVILLIMSIIFADAADQDTIDLNAVKGGFLVQKNLVISGHTNEGSPDTEIVNISEENIIYANFTLIWRDEEDKELRQNQPDRFRMEVTTPGGNSSQDTADNPRNGEGEIFLSFKNVAEEKYNTNETGDYEVIITCVNAGPQTVIGPVPAEPDPDNGNDWTLKVDYIYRVKGGNNVKRILISDYTDEGSSTDFSRKIVDENIVYIKFTLLWKDEENEEGRTNDPDTFILGVTTPWDDNSNETEGTNPQGGEGSLQLTFVNPSKKEQNKEGTGEYFVTIECTAAGDQDPVIGGIGEDDGNDWILIIEYGYNVEFLEPDTFPVP